MDEQDGERVDVGDGCCAAWAEGDGVGLDEQRGEDEGEYVDGEVEDV